MSLIAVKETLDYQSTRPLVRAREVSGSPLNEVMAVTTGYMSGITAVMPPEAEALLFYLFQHALGDIKSMVDRYELLDGYSAVVTEYHECASHAARRMFTYLLYITTREARHGSIAASKVKTMMGLFGEGATSFLVSIKGGSEQQAWKKLQASPPNCTLGEYVSALTWVFNKTKFSGGYGGKKWGMVAECLRKLVYGETSLEQMLDESFSLSHNNGPIFNKGLVYGPYSSDFIRILDLQRGGQIPQAINSDSTVRKHCTPEVFSVFKTCIDSGLSRGFLGAGYVDWFRVEALGAVHKYSKDKTAQIKKYGAATAYSSAEGKTIAEAITLAGQTATAQAKAVYEVSTGVFLPKMERVIGKFVEAQP